MEHEGTARAAVCEQLMAKPFMEHTDPLFWHGRAFTTGSASSPAVIWASDKKPRSDHDTPAWLTASEFEDVPHVLAAKCQQLASLIRLSRKTVLYTGAGISAAVVGQAARSGTNTVGWKQIKGGKLAGKPTFTHYALGALGREGLCSGWVQQNHDGLPQKAGFPQESINEVHGSWYDPSNPVVKYSGSLHDNSWKWMKHDADTADLVIVLGTSLGGLNADRVATDAAWRSMQGACLGTVCINLQQTPEDGKMTLRLFGKSDNVLSRLMTELGFAEKLHGCLRSPPQFWPSESRVLVPYDKDGKLITCDKGRLQMMWLDLRDGSKVKLTPGHNIQGAKQPQYMHIGASRPVKFGKDTREPGPGHGIVVKRDPETWSFALMIEGQIMRLGLWWLDAAVRGAVQRLPIVNLNPTFCTEAESTASITGESATLDQQTNPPLKQELRSATLKRLTSTKTTKATAATVSADKKISPACAKTSSTLMRVPLHKSNAIPPNQDKRGRSASKGAEGKTSNAPFSLASSVRKAPRTSLRTEDKSLRR